VINQRAYVLNLSTPLYLLISAKRLSSYKLIVSNSASKPELEDSSTACGEMRQLPSGAKSTTAHCPKGIVGRYVYLLKEKASYNPPVVCEIEVIGYDLKYSERGEHLVSRQKMVAPATCIRLVPYSMKANGWEKS
jgi:hypothetical protein